MKKTVTIVLLLSIIALSGCATDEKNTSAETEISTETESNDEKTEEEDSEPEPPEREEVLAARELALEGISEEEADRLKHQYGLALKSFIDNDNEILLNTCKDENRKVIKSSELIEIIEARIEEIFSLVNRDITAQGIKPRINNVILTGQGITSINKSDVAGKIILNIPVKISTGRLVSTVRPEYRTAYALVRYIASRPFAKNLSSSIDSRSKENIFKNIIDRIKEFFYS